MGGCMVGWTNLEVTQSIFLIPRCEVKCHIIIYILVLLIGNHFNRLQYAHNVIDWYEKFMKL
jgi:hypothetical protein